jgi:hypothetical protein
MGLMCLYIIGFVKPIIGPHNRDFFIELMKAVFEGFIEILGVINLL